MEQHIRKKHPKPWGFKVVCLELKPTVLSVTNPSVEPAVELPAISTGLDKEEEHNLW